MTTQPTACTVCGSTDTTAHPLMTECHACGEIRSLPTHSWTCDCGQPLSRYRGQSDQQCPSCGQWFNATGERLRSGWAGNPSEWDENVSDLEGYERQQLRRET